MALAWKAGWVHALTSSNLVSSATRITSSRAPVPAPGLGLSRRIARPTQVHRPSRDPPAHPTQTPALQSSASLPTQTPALRPSASTTAQAFDHKTSATQTPPRFASLPALHQPTRNLLAFPHKRQPYGRPPALQRKRPTARQAFGNWTGARRHPRPLDHPGRSATARAAGTMAATMSSSQAGIGPAPDPRKGRTRP